MDLLDLVKTVNSEESKKASAKKPCGYLNLKLGAETIASRGIWAESTSEVKLQAELNELLLEGDQEKIAKVMKALLAKVTFEVTGSSTRNKEISLADFL
jgi:hypothetical protein